LQSLDPTACSGVPVAPSLTAKPGAPAFASVAPRSGAPWLASARVRVLLVSLVLLAPRPSIAVGPARAGDDPAHSVATVDELLRFENDKARDAVRRSREQAGLGAAVPPGLPPPSGTRLSPATPAVTVESISRLGDGPVRVALSVDGRRLDSATVGTRVGACEIVRVAGACVHLAAVPTQRRLARAAGQCPAACWTGLPAPGPRPVGPLPAAPPSASVAAPLSASLAAPPPPLPTLLPPRVPGEATTGGSALAPVLR